jgi:transcriptional regulator with XRE-family HTH domain
MSLIIDRFSIPASLHINNMHNMSIHQRIKAGRLRLGMTETQFADAVGVSRGAVQQWEREGGTAPSRKLQPAVAALIGFSVAELMDENAGLLVIGQPIRQKTRPDGLVIPQFNSGGAMGHGLLLRDQPGVIQSWIVSDDWVDKNIKSHTGAANLCIVTGFGDSMKGMFNSGDPLVIDKGVKSVEFDAVYFFRVADEGFIKRLQRIPGEGIRVLSENKRYESWTIRPDMDFEVFGRVVKAWQGDDF